MKRSPRLTKREAALIDRARLWMESTGRQPFAFQEATWRASLRGESGLVHAATGTGKTLAVALGPMLQGCEPATGKTRAGDRSGPRMLWITPLKALAADTEEALHAALTGLQLPWRLERRTGDTSGSRKSRQLKRLPEVLITTPESASLLLTHAHLADQWPTLHTIVVDEWHELLGSKRGVQTELVLARLRRYAPQVSTWGLSATLGNLPEAVETLVGPSRQRTPLLIRGDQTKPLEIRSMIPERMERFPWTGHIGLTMIAQVAELIDGVSSSLIFANTRSQTELWYQALLRQRPDWAGLIALHHGSLDREVRRWVEDRLRAGKLKTVVCTSSLDLGVDFTAVELVLQIGSSKGVARLLQRAGRSGHQPGATSRLVFVPTHALELCELAAARTAIGAQQIEQRTPLDKPLDVLVQHAMTIAVGGGFRREDLLEEVRTTRAYESLTDQEWDWVLDFLVRGGESLRAYDEYRRVTVRDDLYICEDRRLQLLHRLNIGTIVSDASMRVKYLGGRTLGTVEESFVARMHPGDRFLFAGRLLELVEVYQGDAIVKRGRGTPDTVPRWYGGRLPLSATLSAALRDQLTAAAEGRFIGEEMQALRGLLEVQARWSRIPRRDELLVEQVKVRDGYQVFLYPFAGRLAHEGLAALLAYRLSRQQPLSLTMACNDYGVVLSSSKQIPLDSAIAGGLLSTDSLVQDIQSAMNAAELMRRQFREIARISGLIHPGYPGRPKAARHLQANSQLLFDVFKQYDSGNLLLVQATREVLQHKLDVDRITAALDDLTRQRLVICQPPKLTPLGFPLFVDRLRDRLSSERLADRIRRLQAELEKAAP